MFTLLKDVMILLIELVKTTQKHDSDTGITPLLVIIGTILYAMVIVWGIVCVFTALIEMPADIVEALNLGADIPIEEGEGAGRNDF